jgi:hypothetical protein
MSGEFNQSHKNENVRESKHAGSFTSKLSTSELTLLNQKGKIFSSHPTAVGVLHLASSDAGPQCTSGGSTTFSAGRLSERRRCCS